MKYKVTCAYEMKVLKPETMGKLSILPADKWAVFLGNLKTFYLYFMMFFCYFMAIFSLSLLF